MFGNRKDPMIDTVQKVMDENARRRQIEADLNEELGIQDRKQLGHEKHDLYDQALLQRINEAVLSPKQKSLAAIAGNPKKIDASDFDKLRGMKNEANEEPPGPFDPIRIPDRKPFDPDPPRKKRPDEPKTAKGLAKQAMRDMIAKADKAKPKQNMEEEQIDELSKKTLGSYIKNASHDAAHKSYNVGKMDLQSRTKNDEMDFVGSRKDDDAAEKSFRKSWKRRKFIAKAVDKLTNEDLSLESIQEEIRNNLLERANRLLENGSQDQIVEFMNDLTLEQRSILNMQERLKLNPALNLKTGVVSRAEIPAAAAPPKPPAAPAAQRPGITGRDIVAGAAGAGGAAAVNSGIDSTATSAAKPASRAPVGDQERSDADNNSNNKLTAASAAAAKPASAAARPAPRASAPRAAAPAAARPEIRRTGVDGTESAQDFNYNQASGAYNEPKAAAAPRAARAAAKPATAAAKPAAAATSAPRSGSDIGSPVAGGDARLSSLNRPEPSVSSFKVDAPSKTAGMPDDAQTASDSGIHGMGTTPPKPAAKPAPDPREGGSGSGRQDPNISESRNFERFLRNR